MQVVERWIMARLRRMAFASVAEVNRAIAGVGVASSAFALLPWSICARWYRQHQHPHLVGT
ncbi:hypothetical protein BLL52_0876 [Rhodoferax antarcticus ANT.BR]|uniref:Uncharacterized protein n=1 Tax=Rhodoferax antarcticus ANT.BR TaxID=1111071 RepID=A0A1Q8YIQ6_9BURK|nr:hypothetical protein BLL52_0876 [Rhodoferax antarcticus ANT.BR]